MFKKILTLLFIATLASGIYAQGLGGNSDVTGGSNGLGGNSNVTGGGNGLGGNSNVTGGGNSLGGNSNVTGGGNNLGGNLGKPRLSIPGIVLWFVGLLNYVVVLILTAALVCFLYGVFKLSFFDGTNPESMAKSRKFMLWGIVSLFVMVSVWGLVNILKTSIFGGGSLIVPQLK